jgi:RsiW-degrading membrane proteinase PrsW (M82 family)
MTGPAAHPPVLRQVESDETGKRGERLHLLTTPETVIGRDPRCQIILDSFFYSGVSRQHAKICRATSSIETWQVCDLNSANGTYVNGQRLQGCKLLKAGDRIVLGLNGPAFVFEPHPISPNSVPLTAAAPSLLSSLAAYSPVGEAKSSDLTLSQLFPILATGQDLTRKAYLIPGILTVAVVVLMFVAVGNPLVFNLLLAAYLSGLAFYFIYRLCGKHKPWWVLLSSMLMTMVIVGSPVLRLFIIVFRELLPGNIPTAQVMANSDMSITHLISVVVQMFFGAGLMEELLKALPVLLACYVGMRTRSPLREQIGVWEPLDGILLGAASAVGFTLLETLGQYVPAIISDVTLQAGVGTGELVGLQLLISRILGSIAGHMAYSGYLGYFIGLSMLKPSKRWTILGVGYLTAAALHTLWNTGGSINLIVLAVIGVLSYACLTAAILKARMLSPTRSQNFATRFSKLS